MGALRSHLPRRWAVGGHSSLETPYLLQNFGGTGLLDRWTLPLPYPVRPRQSLKGRFPGSDFSNFTRTDEIKGVSSPPSTINNRGRAANSFTRAS